MSGGCGRQNNGTDLAGSPIDPEPHETGKRGSKSCGVRRRQLRFRWLPMSNEGIKQDGATLRYGETKLIAQPA